MSFLSGSAGGPSRRKGHGSAPPPPATYRHLLSPQAMTVFNPLRTIAHCDIDAAYAQFEQVRLGLPDDVPLICAQWQSIIAVNYPARKYGIKRFTTIDEARKMCPHLIVQHVATYRNGESEAGYWGEVDPKTHKVSLDPYRRESLKILAVFKDMVQRGEIEKASIDEAFLDLTPMVIERLLAAHPYLSEVPDDAPDGLDSPLPPAPPIHWGKAGNVFPIDGETDGETDAEAEADAESRSEDGEYEERPRERGDTWEDWALCIGAEIMRDTRDEVFRRLHYTCSAGIAHNKAMAKLCSAWKKPNNQTVLRAAATPAFLRDRDFTDIRTLGGKLGNAIATEYGAKTVGDMLSVPLEELQSRFGEESIWVYNILRGVDHTEVKERVSTKSMLASKNVRPNVRTPEQGYHWISVLAGELNVRLREAREAVPGLWPKTLVLSHRQGIDPSRSRQTPFPYTRNLSTEYIIKFAKKLWEEATQPMKHGNMKLNNIALSFTGLEKLEEGQQGIENFFSQPKPAPAPTIVSNGDGVGAHEKGRPRPPLVHQSSSTSQPSTGKRPSSPSPPAGRGSSSSPFPSSVVNGASASCTMTMDVGSAGPSPKKPRLSTLHAGKKKVGLDAFLTKSGRDLGARPGTPTPPVPAPGWTSGPRSVPQPLIVDDDDDVLGEDGALSPRGSYSDDAEAGPSGPSGPSGSSHRKLITIDAGGADGSVAVPDEGGTADQDEDEARWTCPQCGTVLSASGFGFGFVGTEVDEEEGRGRALVLAGLKQEHEDWHFAVSLQEGDGPRGPRPGPQPRTGVGSGSGSDAGGGRTGRGGGKSGGKTKHGIKAFFAPRPK